MGEKEISMIQDECRGMFNLLQQLQAPLSENNIAILSGCLGSLKMISRTLEAAKEAQPDEAETE